MTDMQPGEALKILGEAVDQVTCNGPSRRALDSALRVLATLVVAQAVKARIAEVVEPDRDGF